MSLSCRYGMAYVLHILPAAAKIIMTQEYLDFAQQVMTSHDRANKQAEMDVSPAMGDMLTEMQGCLKQLCGSSVVLFAQMYMYNCAHQGSAKEVTPHEGRLLPTTGNSKGLQCCQGIFLDIGLAQTTFCPVSCIAGIADIQCVSKCRSLSHSGALCS